VLSDRSLSQIKFKSSDNHLLTWLKKERIFVDSDSLGIARPTTIGYFTQIAPDLTHLANFRDHLVNQMMLIEIAADDAIALAPHLKAAQLEAMSSGDEFTTILPNFEVYRTRLSHGRTPSQVTTDVIGIKCEPRDAKLLTEFFACLATETNNSHQDGTFVPKGASSLLGPQTYKQIIKDNNRFLTNVATIPINLEYDAWFVVINPHASNKTTTLSLYDHLTCKPWFLRIESVGQKNASLLLLVLIYQQLVLGSMRTLSQWFVNQSQKASIHPLPFFLADSINQRILLPVNHTPTFLKSNFL